MNWIVMLKFNDWLFENLTDDMSLSDLGLATITAISYNISFDVMAMEGNGPAHVKYTYYPEWPSYNNIETWSDKFYDIQPDDMARRLNHYNNPPTPTPFFIANDELLNRIRKECADHKVHIFKDAHETNWRSVSTGEYI